MDREFRGGAPRAAGAGSQGSIKSEGIGIFVEMPGTSNLVEIADRRSNSHSEPNSRSQDPAMRPGHWRILAHDWDGAW